MPHFPNTTGLIERGGVRPARHVAVARGRGQRPDTLTQLARSLGAEARDACADRARQRAKAQLSDVSDPCICGEALLLTAAAALGEGRAPVSAFPGIGEPG